MMMSYNHPKQSGFTLIELMVTMVVAMVVMAGMSSLFVSQTRTAQELNRKSEAMNDLFLAAQIMQAEFRGAKAVCWDVGNGSNGWILYQPLSATSVADELTAACTQKTQNNGYFQLKPIDLINNKPTPFINWKRVGMILNAELIRDMKADLGITITPIGNADLQAVRTITLISQYRDKERKLKDLSLTFKVWPRNTQ